MQTESANAISPELLSQLALCGDAKRYSRNELLIVEGAVSDAVFFEECREAFARGRIYMRTRRREARIHL